MTRPTLDQQARLAEQARGRVEALERKLRRARRVERTEQRKLLRRVASVLTITAMLFVAGCASSSSHDDAWWARTECGAHGGVMDFRAREGGYSETPASVVCRDGFASER